MLILLATALALSAVNLPTANRPQPAAETTPQIQYIAPIVHTAANRLHDQVRAALNSPTPAAATHVARLRR